MADSVVSVIIPTYKRSDMIPATIDSVLMQTYSNVEIIVVDDNNPDTDFRKQTEVRMKQYENNERVKYIRHDKNRNGSAARNTGIEYSIGDYLCFLDDDDRYFENKIEEQVRFLENKPEYAACCCDYINGKKYVQLIEKDDYTREILLLNRTPQTSGIMFRRDAISMLNGFDESYIRHQDYELLLRFFENGFKMGKINQFLYSRDVSGTDNTPNGVKMEGVKKKFLTQFSEIIEEIDINEPGFRKKVYVKHYIQVMKCFAKNRDLLKASQYGIKCLLIHPVYFITELKKFL